MKETNLYVHPEPEQVAQAVADLMMSKLKAVESSDTFFNLAISGGSTPNILFSMLANEYADKIPWEKLRVFWVDERCVPFTDKESNYGTARELWLKNVNIPQENIFRMRGENVPAEEAVRYADVLSQLLPLKEGLPVFDLILLGMGDDGHTASIFPDNMELIHSSKTVASAKHPQTGQNRITLTGDVICNAEQVLFMITGHSKADVLEEIMFEKGDFERYPAYYILSGCCAELYLDDEAAEKL